MPRRPDPDPRQPGLVLVAPGAPVTDAARAAAARKCTIGPGGELWLEWRADRGQYYVAWYDRAARTRRRVATGVGAGAGVDPPRAAHEALAARFAAHARPSAPQPAAEVGVSSLLTRYLAEHCSHPRHPIADPARQGYAVLSIERFIDAQRRSGRISGVLSAADVDKSFVNAFAAFRHAEGVGDWTVKRELGALRAAVAWGVEDGILTSKPHIPKLIGDNRLVTTGRKLAFTLPQLAALLEAAWGDARRHHVHLFIIAMLASHTRVEAALECDLDLQYQHGVIDWLGQARGQTKKRRSMTPVGPTFAAWLDGRSGKMIRYRVATLAEGWADPAVPEYFERWTGRIDTAFDKCLVVAGAAHPSLKLRRPVLDDRGQQRTRIVTRDATGRPTPPVEKPMWQGVGSPNTLRHSLQTQLKRIGVPKEQIYWASGHADPGTGENYTHFDALHDLKDFAAGVEQLFDELRAFTNVHLRTQCGPNIVDLAAARTARSS